MITIVTGLPGTGKSYFASRLADALHAVYINSDRLRKQLFHHPVYTEEEKNVVYGAMLEQTRQALDEKSDIVLDATFYSENSRKMFMELAGSGQVSIIEIQTGESLARERLRQSRDYSDADYVVYKKIQGKWQSIQEPHLVLQSGRDNIDRMLRMAISYINALHDDEHAN